MAATGGGGGGFIGGGGGFIGGGGGGAPLGGAGGQGPAPPPRVFAKVAARYAPLVLPVPLHDLPENYIKNLPKFTGEGDLTATEHINFFDQFVDILGIEHEDVYSRLLVQTFEGQVELGFGAYLQHLSCLMMLWKMLSSDNGVREKTIYII
jgi:hypothetical protein